jgi:DNA-binding beta-propeller fold protein YncE
VYPGSGALWIVDLATGVPSIVLGGLGRPRGLVVLPSGELLISDYQGHTLRKLDLATKKLSAFAGLENVPGLADGHGGTARFSEPYGMALLPGGNVVVADQGNHALRLVTPSGEVVTIAGGNGPGMVDGPAMEAHFHSPRDVAVDAAGNIYVTDVGNHRIRRLGLDGMVQTVAGDGTAGFADGEGTAARFFGQEGIDAMPDGKIVVADGSNGEKEPYHRVRVLEVP